MKKWYVLFVLLLTIITKSQAQIDTEFWFAAPDLYGGHAEQPIRFCVSSFDNPATVVFEQPANSSFTPRTFNLEANSFCVFDISDILNIVETQPANTVLDYGFHIYSTTPVSVYYESDNCNSEIYSLKGTNALGTSFIVPMQTAYGNYHNPTNIYNRIEVVAVEDGTTVTFIPSQPIKGGGQPGVPITVILNRGQTYAIEANSPHGADHLRNTVITSDKPIAVNTSDDSVCLGGAADLIGDQIVPITLVGTEYVALWNSTPNEHLYFFPTQDNTSIYLNGSTTPVATIDKGQEYDYVLNSLATYVHSDKPIVVFQLTSDPTEELGGTILPHIKCTGSRKVVYKRNGYMEITITLVVNSSCVNDFILNGNTDCLTGADFNTIPSNPEYSYCIKNISQYIPYDGLIKIENSNEDGFFQMGVFSNGNNSGTSSYGFFSDYQEYAYAKFNMIDTYCTGEDIYFFIDAESVENLTLILPDGTTITQQPFVLTNVQTTQSGTYKLQGENCNGTQILDEIDINIINCVDPEIPLPDNIDSANCVFFPTATDWGIELSWTSANIVSDFNTPLVGDLDDDGLPEIVCFSNDGQTWYDPRKVNKVLVFDGVTKQVKTTISLPTYVTAYDGAAYGLVKTSSRKGLIIIACYDFKLRAYDITSSDPNTPYWVSNENYGSDEGDWAVNVNFADFNHDGHPEIFVRNKIYNAETGVLLATANGGTNTSSSYCHFTHVTHWKMSTSIAADMCNDSRLELILGNEIYDVDITNPNGTSGNAITLVRQITPPSGVPVDGNAQVADFNADGYLDVFISIRDTDGHYGNVYCYVWDVHNNTVSNPLTINTSFSGKSIPMIADIDNDELLEVLIQSGVNGSVEKFQTYKYHPDTQTFSFMWGITTDEDSYSNSITSFDFNQDGLLELMISDQANVRIVNGSGFSHITHNDTIPVYVMNTFPFVAITIMQYPIIADVDNDGNAEIVAVGGERLNIFESAETAWAPTRKVWNQYMYNVTNVNNDLTIPQYQFNNATAFTDPENVVRRPFNNFLQQATTIDQYGRPFYGVTDAEAFLADISNHGDITTLDFTYTNSGDNALNAPYSITVFANHLGGEIIQTITVDNPLQVGDTALQSFNFTAAELCQASDLNNIVVAVNCAGGGIAQNDNLQPECDTNNNTLQIAVELQSEPTYLTETVCDQHLWNGVSYSSSGVFQQTLTNTMGCDSLVILNLTVNHSDTVSNIVSVCDSYTWHNQSYSTSGDYSFDTVNDSGCNRLETLHLTVNQSYNNDIAVNSCDGVYNWNGIPYSESGTYQQSFTTVGGCDSIVNMTLNIAEAFETTIDTTVCDAFLWDNSSITESGNYRFQHLMASGCDSVVNLNLTVERTPQLAIHGLTQVAISTDLWPGVYNYCIADSLELEDCDITWECSNPDWILLPHINRYWRRIIAKTLGKATLTVSTQCNSGCDKTFSLEINASYFDTDENLDNVSVFPNPSTGSVTVQGRDIVAVRVFNLLGQKVAEFHFERKDGCTVDLGSFQDAVYIMEISTTHMTLNKKVVLTK